MQGRRLVALRSLPFTTEPGEAVSPHASLHRLGH